MKTKLLLFFILYVLVGCKQISKKIDLKVSYDIEKKYLTVENNTTNHSYGWHNICYDDLYMNYGYKEPVYCIDSLNKLLYIYNIGPLGEIIIYNIEEDTLVKEIPIKYLRNENYNIMIYCYKDYIILKSNWRCDIWDKDFSVKTSLKDTTFSNYPICYRYTTDYIPEVKNDTLFLSVHYEGGIVDTLIHTVNYIFDLRRKEFITNIEPCKRVLSKGIF